MLELTETSLPFTPCLLLPLLCAWRGPDIFDPLTVAKDVFDYVKSGLGVPQIGWLEFDYEIYGLGPRSKHTKRKLLFLAEDQTLSPLLTSLQSLQERFAELSTGHGRMMEKVTVRPRLDLISPKVLPVDWADPVQILWVVCRSRPSDRVHG